MPFFFILFISHFLVSLPWIPIVNMSSIERIIVTIILDITVISRTTLMPVTRMKINRDAPATSIKVEPLYLLY